MADSRMLSHLLPSTDFQPASIEQGVMDSVDKEELNSKETKDSVLVLDNCILNIVKNKFSELLICSLSAVHP